jgi:hypothetical protein
MSDQLAAALALPWERTHVNCGVGGLSEVQSRIGDASSIPEYLKDAS